MAIRTYATTKTRSASRPGLSSIGFVGSLHPPTDPEDGVHHRGERDEPGFGGLASTEEGDLGASISHLRRDLDEGRAGVDFEDVGDAGVVIIRAVRRSAARHPGGPHVFSAELVEHACE